MISYAFKEQKKRNPRFSRAYFFSRFSDKSDGHAQKVSVLLLSSQTRYRPLLHRYFSRRRSGRFFKMRPGIDGGDVTFMKTLNCDISSLEHDREMVDRFLNHKF